MGQRTPLIAGNWKMNKTAAEAAEMINELKAKVADVSDVDRALITETSRDYLDAGINVLGYDLLRNDDGGWLISEINAGNIGGLFRLEYLGVAGVTDRFVDWLHRHANQTHREGRPPPMPTENVLETSR